MNKIVDLYVSRKDITTKMDVVQASTEPDITFVLKDYTPPTGATARIYIKKPLSEVYNTCTISGNEVTFQPTTGSFDQVGPCTAQLEILKGDEVMVSYRIYVMVEPNTIDSGAIEASDDFTALLDALAEVGDISALRTQVINNTTNITQIKNTTDKLVIVNDQFYVAISALGEPYIRWKKDSLYHQLKATNNTLVYQTYNGTAWAEVWTINIDNIAAIKQKTDKINLGNLTELKAALGANNNPYLRWTQGGTHYQIDCNEYYIDVETSPAPEAPGSWTQLGVYRPAEYKAGESVTFEKNRNIFAGHVTSGTKQLVFTIPLPRLAYGRTCSLRLTNTGLTARTGAGGYVDGGDINVNASGFTLTCVPCAVGVYVYVNKTTNYTNVTNNSSCSIAIEGTLTFS